MPVHGIGCGDVYGRWGAHLRRGRHLEDVLFPRRDLLSILVMSADAK